MWTQYTLAHFFHIASFVFLVFVSLNTNYHSCHYCKKRVLLQTLSLLYMYQNLKFYCVTYFSHISEGCLKWPFALCQHCTRYMYIQMNHKLWRRDQLSDGQRLKLTWRCKYFCENKH